jgi:sulfonate transport system permease protein
MAAESNGPFEASHFAPTEGTGHPDGFAMQATLAQGGMEVLQFGNMRILCGRRRLVDGSLFDSIGATVIRMLFGWVLASLVGIVVGAVIGSSRLAASLLMPTFEALRPLPASAVIPIAILVFGLNEAMSVFVIAFASLWPVLLTAIHGFRNVPVGLREVAAVLEMGRVKAFFIVSLPAAFVDIFPGLRTGLALALILTVVTEMQASLPGVGHDIFLAQRAYRSADLYAALIVIGLIGFAINQLIVASERRLFPWLAK